MTEVLMTDFNLFVSASNNGKTFYIRGNPDSPHIIINRQQAEKLVQELSGYLEETK